MPAAFSGRRLGRLLLLLLCTSLSGGSPADPAMTTQDSSQTQVNSVTKMQAGLNVTKMQAGLNVSSGPDLVTEELKPASKQDTYNVSEYEIVLSGNLRYCLFPVLVHAVLVQGCSRGTSLKKNVPVGSPTKVGLICKLDEHAPLKNPQVTWKKGSETISHTTKTWNSWSIQVTVSDRSHLGSYICILKGEIEISATFHLQVPQIEGKEKPMIAYEGDIAVMLCKTELPPKSWTWYMTNGTELVRSPSVGQAKQCDKNKYRSFVKDVVFCSGLYDVSFSKRPCHTPTKTNEIPIDPSSHRDKFRIKKQSATTSRLKIYKLTKKDAGVYWCEAAFELGKSKGRFELKVLSIMAPLKPFLAIVAEVSILVITIFLYEVYSKRKEKSAEGEREFDQIEQLKSEEDVAAELGNSRQRRL